MRKNKLLCWEGNEWNKIYQGAMVFKSGRFTTLFKHIIKCSYCLKEYKLILKKDNPKSVIFTRKFKDV